MAKQPTAGENLPAKYSAQEAEDALNDIFLGRDTKITRKEAFEIFESLPDSQFDNNTGEYLKFEVGETYNLEFRKIEDRTIKGRKQEVCCFSDVDGNDFITGSTVCVNTLKKVDQIPCLVRIHVKGKKQGKDGEYFDLDIFTIKRTA